MSFVRVESIRNRTVQAVDGEVGSVFDIYFTDDAWQTEYIVVRTGSYFSGRRLLLVNPSLIRLTEEAWKNGAIPLDATRDEIFHSPDYGLSPDEDPPVSEQKKQELHPQFLWLPTGDLSKIVLRPLSAAPQQLEVHDDQTRAAGMNPHLRSYREVHGYAVYGGDDHNTSLAHIGDMILGEEAWDVVRLVAVSGLPPQRKRYLMDPSTVAAVDWAGANVYLELDAAEFTSLPVDDPEKNEVPSVSN